MLKVFKNLGYAASFWVEEVAISLRKGGTVYINSTGALTIFCPLMIQGLIPDTVSIFMFLYIPSNSATLSWHCWVDRKLYLVN